MTQSIPTTSDAEVQAIDPKLWAEAVKFPFNGKPLWIFLADHPESAEHARALLQAYLVLARLHSSEEYRRGAWLPIETAPKDGTEVLLWLGAPWLRVEKARWYVPWSNWQAGIIPSDPAREKMHGIGSAVPLYWRPLPDPPALAATSAGEKR